MGFYTPIGHKGFFLSTRNIEEEFFYVSQSVNISWNEFLSFSISRRNKFIKLTEKYHKPRL